MLFNIIGTGRLGHALAHALITCGGYTLQAVYNRQLTHSMQAIEQLGQGVAIPTIATLPLADMTFITVPDDAISPVTEALANTPHALTNHVFVHCSGALSSTVLAPLKAQGAVVASIHFLKAFPLFNPCHAAFKGIHGVIEGDDRALEWLMLLGKRLGVITHTIKASNKATYHAAAVMAANYTVTLAYDAEQLFVAAGFNQAVAQCMARGLIKDSLDNVMAVKDTKEALTGPLSRGDSQTIAMHLEAIDNGAIRQLYVAAALATLDLTALPLEQQKAIGAVIKTS